MNSDTDGLQLSEEQLLRNLRCLRALARSLLGAGSEAEDVVQEALLVGQRRGGDARGALLPWLAGVVRHLSFRVRRREARARRREAAAARSEVDASTPDALLERAEIHGRVVQCVCALPEPYRSTILLRFFEELGPSEIASRQDVSVNTVATRIRRGLERLRRELAARGIDERALLLVLPTGGIAETLAASATFATSATSSASALSSLPTATSAIGGTIMSIKVVTSAGAAAVICAAAIWGYVASSSPDPLADAPEQDDARVAHLEGEVARLREAGRRASERAAAAIAVRARHEARLAARLAELEAAAASPVEEEPIETAAEIETGDELPVAFGALAEVEAFRNADWDALAEAAGAVNEIWLAHELARLEGGEDGEAALSPEDDRELLAINDVLTDFVSALRGHVDSHAPINGEFTHPLTTSNLVTKLLDAAGAPVTDDQRRAFERLGGEFEARYAETQRGYDEGTPNLRKMLDELALKNEFLDGMKGALSPDQRQLAFPVEIENRLRRDIFSPLVSAMASARVEPFSEPGQARTSYVERLRESYGLSDAQAELVAPAVDHLLEELRANLETAQPPGESLDFDRVLRSGRAHGRVLEEILALPGLPDEIRERVLGDFRWPVLVRTRAES